nr:biotin--[acetyl-CoA-carboxylase] ligase [Candidatus Dadabacteria bacterium]
VVVVSDYQHTGRGRLDRRWVSPPASNIYMSCVLEPRIKIEEVNIFTFISSLATVNTLLEYEISSYIKWPNDVLIGGKKVCGVLTELNIHDDKLKSVVVGVGVNLNMDSKALESHDLAAVATSVYIESGKEVDRNQFLIKMLNNLDECYDKYSTEGKEYIIEKWTDRWSGKDRNASVSLDGQNFTARCVCIDDNGYLVVEKPSGQKITVVSGDVQIL